MARYPVPGRVKTRLATALGAERACTLYRAFVLDLADRLATLPYRVTWAYTPAGAPFAALVPGARCRAQRGGDLGARMTAAVASAFAGGPGPVLVLGADVPHVPAAYLAEAAAALHGRADVVLGPAEDGGYYLIGFAAPRPELLRGVSWGTAGVLAATQARAARCGLRVHCLGAGFDVDEPADLERLAAAVERGEVLLPRTASLLAAAPGTS